MITRMIAAVVVLFAILLMLLPRSDETSLARIASASMLMCTKDFRAALAEELDSGNGVGVSFDNRCPGLIVKVDVEEDGRMTIHGKEHGLKLVLSPKPEEGEVRWSCRGDPAGKVTPLCKE
jgi:hypothetical protein